MEQGLGGNDSLSDFVSTYKAIMYLLELLKLNNDNIVRCR